MCWGGGGGGYSDIFIHKTKDLEEETSVVTVQDIKRHARASIRRKWQHRWDIGEFGRDFYLCKPFLDSNPRLDFPNTRMFKQILQLRTGYSILNDYRHKLGQCESGLCECGQMETVQHYTYFSVNYTKKRGICYITDFENSWAFTHQMFTSYLGMMDIGNINLERTDNAGSRRVH